MNSFEGKVKSLRNHKKKILSDKISVTPFFSFIINLTNQLVLNHPGQGKRWFLKMDDYQRNHDRMIKDLGVLILLYDELDW